MDKEPLVASLLCGVAWELGQVRLAWTRTYLGREFEGQPEGQVYGSLIVSWSRAF